MRWLIMLALAIAGPFAHSQDAPEAPEEADDPVAIALADEPENSDAPVVVVCEITGMIDEGVKVVVQRTIKEAEDLDAKVIIFRVDTPGGRVDSAVEIAKAIESAHCKTVSYIEGMGAISAGALISYACDEIVMTPGSNMGAAAPVMMSPEGTQALGEKEISFVRAKMRALAESNDHNPDIAQAMVDKDIELRGYVDDNGEFTVYATNPGVKAISEEEPNLVDALLEGAGVDVPESESEAESAAPAKSLPAKQGSEVILAQGKLLTLTPKEALKYGVITEIVDDFDHALSMQVDSPEYRQHMIEANWAETTFRFLTNPTIAGLLLMLAIGGLYVEVRTPGFGIPGMIGATCLVLLFGAHYVLGLAEVLDLLLILAGVILIAFEVFVIPGFGLAGIAGFACLVIGMYLTMTSFTFPEYSWQFDRLVEVAYSLIVASVASLFAILASWKILPATPLYNTLVLAADQNVADGFTAQTEEVARAAIGLEGTTTSMLRPAGKGRFEGKLCDIVSRGDFLEKGVAVRIIEAEGNRYVVEPITTEQA